MNNINGSTRTDIKVWETKVSDQMPLVKDTIETAVSFLADCPEPGGEEFKTAGFICDQLEALGYQVERGVADMPTAFTASFAADKLGGNIGIAVVIDGVPAVDSDGNPAPDHSCGHLAIAAGAIAVAQIWKNLCKEAQGSLTILGCPADEHATDISRTRGGGKAALADAGILDELDAVLYVHPEDRNMVLQQTQCSLRFRGTLEGKRIPGELPELVGKMAQFGNEVEYRDARSAAYIERITSVGDADNGAKIIVMADLMVRAHTEEELADAVERVMEKSDGIRWQEMTRYDGLKSHKELTEQIEEVFETMGINYDPDPPLIPYATDFGRMTNKVPGALIGLGDHRWAFHTPECSAAFLKDAVPEAEQYARVTSVIVPVLAKVAQEW